MTTTSVPTKSPSRVRAGSANRAHWKGFTPAGLERLRETARRNAPWRFSTGPRTAEGKARAALNGRLRQKGRLSVRQVRAEVADVGGIISMMGELRQSLRGG